MIEPVDINNNIDIYFRESDHKYTDQFDNEYTSVTTLIHKYVPHFDQKYWARKKAIEAGISEKEMLKQWAVINKHSTDKGTKVHNHLEAAIKKTSIFKAPSDKATKRGSKILSIKDIEFSSGTNISLSELENNLAEPYKVIIPTIKYYVDKGYKIYSEVNVFHPVYLISGTIDILLVNEHKDFVIVDWKTNRKDIFFESGYFKKLAKGSNVLTNTWVKTKDKLLYPLSHLDKCDGMIYTLQLSLYSILLEAFGLRLRGLILFHIRDKYILNEYGMPVVLNNGMYVPDGDLKEIKPYSIRYLKKECATLINTYYKDRKLDKALYKQNKLNL